MSKGAPEDFDVRKLSPFPRTEDGQASFLKIGGAFRSHVDLAVDLRPVDDRDNQQFVAYRDRESILSSGAMGHPGDYAELGNSDSRRIGKLISPGELHGSAGKIESGNPAVRAASRDSDDQRGSDRLVAETLVRDDLRMRLAVLHGGAIMAFAGMLGACATALNLR
jgi:hypothetical protein